MLEAWSRCPQWATTVLQQLSGTTRPPASPERIHSLSRQSWELLLPQQRNCRGTGQAKSPPHPPYGGTARRPQEGLSHPPTSCCSLSTALVTPSWPGWWYCLVMVSFRFSLSSVFNWG